MLSETIQMIKFEGKVREILVEFEKMQKREQFRVDFKVKREDSVKR